MCKVRFRNLVQSLYDKCCESQCKFYSTQHNAEKSSKFSLYAYKPTHQAIENTFSYHFLSEIQKLHDLPALLVTLTLTVSHPVYKIVQSVSWPVHNLSVNSPYEYCPVLNFFWTSNWLLTNWFLWKFSGKHLVSLWFLILFDMAALHFLLLYIILLYMYFREKGGKAWIAFKKYGLFFCLFLRKLVLFQ